MSATQAHRVVAVGTPLGDDVLMLAELDYAEALGSAFECQLDLISEQHDVPFHELLGQSMTVRMALSDDQTRYINGVVSRFEQTATDVIYEDAERGQHYTRYTATLRPWLWFLTRTSDCRVFQDQTVPEIIMSVFRDRGFNDFEAALTGSYRKWSYCVQYRETDFNFISRLMEQEGIYYFFRHEDGKHTLVLTDDYVSHESVEGYEQIPFYQPTENIRERDNVSSWSVRQQLQPGKWSHTDYNFRVPRKSQEASALATRDHEHADFEVFDYPGEFVNDGGKEGDDGDETSAAEQYAKARIQQLQADHEIVRAAGNAAGLAAGFLFELTGHPREDQNREYLITGLSLHVSSDAFAGGGQAGEESDVRISFTCIPGETPFRPTRATPKPTVQGPQTAVVVGPSGQELYVDEFGRVKVQFHWDRYGRADENSSCWLRCSMPIAGRNWGFVALPRIGQEVIVEFLEGDPDRPIITGGVYNGANQPPYKLPDNATMTAFKSNSSPGGGGFNELRFEDKKGEEQVFLHAQNNYDTRVGNDSFTNVGNNQHCVIRTDRREKVGADLHQTLGRDHVEKIGRDHHAEIGGKRAEKVGMGASLKVGMDLVEDVGMNHTDKVGMNWLVKAGMMAVIEAPLGITLKCGGNSIVLDPVGVTIKGTMLTLDGTMTRINSGPGSPPGVVQPGQLVSPTSPTKPDEADEAEPGKVEEIKAEQRKTQSGKYGRVEAPKFVPPDPQDPPPEDPVDFLELELVDDDGNPVAGERYKVTLPDGSVDEGVLDSNGYVRLDGVDPGQCQIEFPYLDSDAWDNA